MSEEGALDDSAIYGEDQEFARMLDDEEQERARTSAAIPGVCADVSNEFAREAEDEAIDAEILELDDEEEAMHSAEEEQQRRLDDADFGADEGMFDGLDDMLSRTRDIEELEE